MFLSGLWGTPTSATNCACTQPASAFVRFNSTYTDINQGLKSKKWHVDTDIRRKRYNKRGDIFHIKLTKTKRKIQTIPFIFLRWC
uniref:Uncharacterized protein n=1 Tax=Anguilla anguilla TaxID=7936 RepID=A0A0E9X8Y9_ANGAN